MMDFELPDLKEDTQPIDDWLSIENEYLKDEIDQAVEKVKDAEARADDALAQKSEMFDRLQQGERKWQREVADENHTLTNKVVLMSRIMDEYQRLLDQYVSLTGTKLTTTALDELMKDGGFKV